ncbi:MAG: DUF1499 domain-containing protein [Leptolyngbyaceae bacterium]|nr:DUF1499 domain-containing protein [Leptolyngbyaceae bacterium]
MAFLLSLLCSGIIGLLHWLTPSPATLALPISVTTTLNSPPLVQLPLAQFVTPASLSRVAAIPGFKTLFAGTPPTLGVNEGQLSPCPPSPNCVVSQGDPADAGHKIAPIEYGGDRATAHDTLLTVLMGLPRTEVVAEAEDYIRIAATSQLMGFVDDAEFYFPEDEAIIHVRSASRLGESDLGVNRDRIEQIRMAMPMTSPPLTEAGTEEAEGP